MRLGTQMHTQTADRTFFATDSDSERWRQWACGHNMSAEYDGSATLGRRSWFGRQSGVKRKSARR
jgi:hypothetical protein